MLNLACKVFDISLEILADFVVAECNLAVSLHNAELVAHIVTDAVEIESKKVAFLLFCFLFRSFYLDNHV